VFPYAVRTLERGITSGRFQLAETHIALTGIVGSALAVMRAILDGRYGSEADVIFAEGVLRSVGLDRGEAGEVARREYAEIGSLRASTA
jgi:hypothetical protein